MFLFILTIEANKVDALIMCGHEGSRQQRAFSLGTDPVSYTHLDVYKRQRFILDLPFPKTGVEDYKNINGYQMLPHGSLIHDICNLKI